MALVLAWVGLFAGQPSVKIKPYGNNYLKQPSASYKLLLSNLIVVDTKTGKLTPNMSILCADGKIAEIAPRGSIKVDGENKVVDASGKYIVPGYLNMHMHVIGNPHTQETMDLLLADGDFTSSVDQPAMLTMPGDILTPINAPTPEVAMKLVDEQKKRERDLSR